MKKILIGTHNQGKFKEISHLISKRIKKISPVSLGIPSPKETAKTFSGNARLKANYFSKFVDFPVISDDSGLCVKKLNNKPGIHSARLAKREGSFLKAMKLILKKLKKKKDRNAKFVCSLAFKFPKKKTISVTGEVQGKISKKILGENGFGYDSIFIPKYEKLTFGQISKSKKIKIDHRFRAIKKLKKQIKTL